MIRWNINKVLLLFAGLKNENYKVSTLCQIVSVYYITFTRKHLYVNIDLILSCKRG